MDGAKEKADLLNRAWHSIHHLKKWYAPADMLKDEW